jgi:hypothetical protein
MTNDRPRRCSVSIDANVDTVASSVKVADDVSVSTESHRTEQLNVKSKQFSMVTVVFD